MPINAAFMSYSLRPLSILEIFASLKAFQACALSNAFLFLSQEDSANEIS
jgi:hypothetical protein